MLDIFLMLLAMLGIAVCSLVIVIIIILIALIIKFTIKEMRDKK